MNIMNIMKEVRREAALKRNAEWAEKGPREQLAELDRRLGKDVGAKKQRERIKRLIGGVQ